MPGIEIKSFVRWIKVTRVISLVAALLVCSACPGCGSKEASPLIAATVPVKGKVTYKGKPLTRGEIMFHPVSGTMFAHGTIKGDGSFQLTTFTPGDGAAVGIHRVSLSHLNEKARVPAEYMNSLTLKFEVEVVEGKDEYLVELK